MEPLLIILPLAGLFVGAVLGYVAFRYVLKGIYNRKMQLVKKEAEVLKETKLLEVKEKFLN